MTKKQKNINPSSLPLVVLDLGSSGVRAMAAERVDYDTLRILAYEHSNQNARIEHGVVANSSNIAFMINEAIRLLCNRLDIQPIPAACVLLGGQSMQTVPVKSHRDQVVKQVVSDALLDELEEECKNKIENKYPSLAVLGLVPCYYIADGVMQNEAPSLDQRVRNIEAHYTAFVGNRALVDKVSASFDRAGKSIDMNIIRPEALLSAFAASEPEILDEGCAVLDFGAETMTLSVFKGDSYLLTHVFANGSEALTDAIASHDILLTSARKAKEQIGVASPRFLEKDAKYRLKSANGESTTIISLSEMAGWIEEKLDLIMAPVLEALKPYEGQIGKILLTGGGSQLNGLLEYLQPKTSIEVGYGDHSQLLAADTDEEWYSPEYSSLIGGLIIGADYRENHPNRVIAPPKIIDKAKGIILDVFGTNQI
ncbi:MAG: hypothetical protein MJZ82_04915 [Paludibacteraceae bacterium]|nr:hypothetical protein [Paludibacteraceae bacterium]